MSISSLNAISPIDGRYRNIVENLAPYFSEEALIKYRVLVEIEYFIALCELPLPQLKSIETAVFDDLRKIYQEFSSEDAQKIKDIEKKRVLNYWNEDACLRKTRSLITFIDNANAESFKKMIF